MTGTSKLQVVTRKSTDIWLVGQTLTTLSQTKLPNKREALSIFFHYKNDLNLNIRDSAQCAATDVLIVSEKANIPTRLKKHVIDKIENLFRERQKLKKNKEKKTKCSDFIKQKEEDWKLSLEGLFDIAHANALNTMKIDEDKDFLLAQRQKGRPGKMGPVDKSFVKKVTELERKKKRFDKMKEREEESKGMLFEETSIPSDIEEGEEKASCSLAKKRLHVHIVNHLLKNEAEKIF